MSTIPTTPPRTRARHRAGPAERRFGYLVAAVVNAVMLYLVNVSPGWEALPFLTRDFPQVLGLVNASIAVGVVANVVYLVRDPQWLRALGDVVTTAVGLAALVSIWQVWPIDLDTAWDLLARWVVGVGVVGSVIAIVVAVVRFVGSVSTDTLPHTGPPPSGASTRHA